MIVQHGRVVAQWGDPTAKSKLHSVRKSLLSALIGIAVEAHKIDLGATMEGLGIDDKAPSLSAVEKTATVADLLKARSGIYHLALGETPDMAQRRPERGSHAPGTFWYYNNWDFNALGTIYELATGESIFNALDSRIARPIGMQDYQPGDGRYLRGRASEHPAYLIRMSARDLARFALLYLHDGTWKGRPIVPASWIHDSVQSHSRAYPERGPGLGYGYMWWTGFPSDMGAPTVKVPPGTFLAWGVGGQYAFVIPAFDLVVVHRIDSDAPGNQGRASPSMRQIARLLWLVLSAAGDGDVGPDVSLEHAAGEHLVGDPLKMALAGRTLSYGDSLVGGPYAWRIAADGTLSISAGPEREAKAQGSWRIGDDGRFCPTLPRAKGEDCYSVVADQGAVRLFGADGLMRYDMKPK
jgi:CubicO group peptidase (beta-lactamase class C family)